jgi:hypothetical protein
MMEESRFISVSSNGLVVNLEFFKEVNEGIPFNINFDYSSPKQSWEIETLGVWIDEDRIREFVGSIDISGKGALLDKTDQILFEVIKDGKSIFIRMPSFPNSPTSANGAFEITVRIDESFLRDLVNLLLNA